jgi:hypothetical protein
LRIQKSNEPAKTFAIYEPHHGTGSAEEVNQKLGYHQYIASILPGEHNKPKGPQDASANGPKKRKLDEGVRPEDFWNRNNGGV